MALYVISWRDKPGGLALRMATREAHLAYAASLDGRVKLGGPYLDGDGQMMGSLMIVEADDLAHAQALHDKDPYKLADLFEASEITPWRVTLNSLA